MPAKSFVFRKHVSAPRLEELALCTKWNDVVALFERASANEFTASPGDAKSLLDLLTIIRGSCPKHDFSRDSVQHRLLEFLGPAARKAFRIQEAARLFLGFELATDSIFGSGWRSDLERVVVRYLIWQTEQFANAPELVTDVGAILSDAYKKKDFRLYRALAEKLQRGTEGYAAFLADAPMHRVQMPALDVATEICRNWTNPDFPLWLMQDRAAKQALRYLTGGHNIDDRAIQQRISRMGLKRFQRRPIREMAVHPDKDRSVLRFKGFTFTTEVEQRMRDVETALGYAENGQRTIGSLPGYV